MIIIIIYKWIDLQIVSNEVFRLLAFHNVSSGDLEWLSIVPASPAMSCRDELIRDVLLWIPTHGRAKAGRPARTYIQQLCEDTGCCPEDLPRAMNDREEWRERVRDIRAASTIWWWMMKYSSYCCFYRKDCFERTWLFLNVRVCFCEWPIGIHCL